MARAEAAGGPADLVLTDDVSGTVVTMAVSRGPGGRLSLDRVLVFLADGVTLWYHRDFAGGGHRPDLAWTLDGRTRRIRVSAHAREDLQPAEHRVSAAAREPFRVPLTLDLSLEPLSLPVPEQRRFPGGGLAGSQVYRATGSVAGGSVIHEIRGRSWVGETAFSTRANDSGARLQAAFQDGSSLLVTAPREPDAVGPAALQADTRMMPLTASVFRVDGPARRIPTRMICRLDGVTDALVRGGYRSLDQHLAFVQEAGSGWVRRAYTPFDVARSGVTGFGILEQVGRVRSPDAPPVIGTGIPETF